MARLKELLKGRIPDNLLQLVPRSFDIVGSRTGSVAIVELPDEVKPYAVEVAKAIMSIHKNVKSVLVKASERLGEYRLRRLELVYGDEDTEVFHREHGCVFKLDPRKVYFSPREATERMRIARMVSPGERVLVMFSGVCPYPITIAKTQPLVEVVYGVELNPDAHRYCVENVRLNKVEGKVVPLPGDVREVCPSMKGMFDRVVMPLPRGAHMFLDLAVECLKHRGVIHFYHWAREPDLFSEAEELLKKEAERQGCSVKVVGRQRVLPYAPRVWKVRVDAAVEK